MMKNRYNNHALQDIRNIEELRYQRRLLASRIEQQEVMISHKVEVLKKAWSPANLAYMGLESLAVRKPAFIVILKAFKWIRSKITKY